MRFGSKESQYSLAAHLILLSAPVYFAVVVLRFWNTGQQNVPIFFTSFALEGICVVCCLCIGVVCHVICKTAPSNYLSHYEIIKFFFINSVRRSVLGTRSYKRFVAASLDPKGAQSQWLTKFLAERKDTVIGKDFGFDQIQSVGDFIKKLPITEYDVYRRYAERAASGEADVLAKGKPNYIVLTSGTTGNNKLFPMTDSCFRAFLVDGMLVSGAALGNRFPAHFHLRRQLSCWVVPNIIKHEKSGIRMGPFSGYFDLSSSMMLLTTPSIAFKETLDENVMMYVHALFGLLHEDVEVMLMNFVSLARSFIAAMETRWKDIVEDIRLGTLNTSLDIPQEIRQGLQEKLWANPARAAALTREFEKGFDNILPRIFPQVEFILMTASGTLQTPTVTLQKKYFPTVAVVSSVHLGSEGLYGISLDPGDIQRTFYTLLPQQAFYEFIPLEDVPKTDPPTKLMHELKLNEEYELCMTTDRGIFRFRTGDIIKVLSYFNKTPQYEFIGRYGQLLNVCGEKTSENSFNTALEDTMAKLKREFSLIDYTTAESRTVGTAETGRYYLLFLELEKRNPDVTCLSEEQKTMFDADQQMYNEGYRELRVQGRIQTIKVIETRPGAFLELKLWILRNNPKTSSGQFKTPRVLRNEKQVEFMMGQAR